MGSTTQAGTRQPASPPPGLPQTAIRVRSVVAERFAADSGGHDLAHLDRVARLADRIAQAEGADREIVTTAAYCHDFHRLLEAETEHAAPIASGACGELVQAALEQAHADPSLSEPVLECVAFCDRHRFAGDDAPAPLEARVLSDADNLDAIGAIGIARAFAFGALLGEPMWEPDLEARDRYVRGRTSSVIHHFEEKLLRLRDDMLTSTGRAVAGERHRVIADFVDTFRREWRAEDVPVRATRARPPRHDGDRPRR